MVHFAQRPHPSPGHSATGRGLDTHWPHRFSSGWRMIFFVVVVDFRCKYTHVNIILLKVTVCAQCKGIFFSKYLNALLQATSGQVCWDRTCSLISIKNNTSCPQAVWIYSVNVQRQEERKETLVRKDRNNWSLWWDLISAGAEHKLPQTHFRTHSVGALPCS